MRTGIVMSLILLSPALSRAERTCSEDLVCVVTHERGDRVDFAVESRDPGELTITFEVSVENAVSSVRLPHTAVFGPGESPAFTLRRKDPKKGFTWDYSFHWQRGDSRAVHDERYVYSLPYASGSAFEVSQGWRGSFSHTGDMTYAVDFLMPEGTPVLAAREGLVVALRSDATKGGPDPDLIAESNYVYVRHPDRTMGKYSHLRPNGVAVKVGQTVRVGELIGYSGATGFVNGPHLHFVVSRPLNGRDRVSLPARFAAREGARVEPKLGRRYTAP